MADTTSFLQSAVDATGQTTYTFSGQSLGAAASDRHIIVEINARSGGARTLDSVTIGGVSATINVNIVNSAGGNTTLSAISIANVPTGTTGDIVAVFSAAMARCGYGAYRATDLASSTPDDTGSSTANAPTTTLNVPADGFAVGGIYAVTGSDGSISWSGLGENYDEEVGGTTSGTGRHSGAKTYFASEQVGITITATPNDTSNAANAGAFASWGIGAPVSTFIPKVTIF